MCKGLFHEGSLYVSSHAGDGLLVGASRRLALTGLEDGKIRPDTWVGPYKLIPDKSDHSHSIVAGGLLLMS